MPRYQERRRLFNQLSMANQNEDVRHHIIYSDRYSDDLYEYRHVILPPELAAKVPQSHLLSETEWRNLGLQQSTGWIHYMWHKPEPHVLLFRRLKAHPDPSDFGQHNGHALANFN